MANHAHQWCLRAKQWAKWLCMGNCTRCHTPMARPWTSPQPNRGYVLRQSRSFWPFCGNMFSLVLHLMLPITDPSNYYPMLLQQSGHYYNAQFANNNILCTTQWYHQWWSWHLHCNKGISYNVSGTLNSSIGMLKVIKTMISNIN